MFENYLRAHVKVKLPFMSWPLQPGAATKKEQHEISRTGNMGDATRKKLKLEQEAGTSNGDAVSF